MPTEDILQWSATFTGIVAAIMVALNFDAKISGWGFVIFSLSSLLWVSFGLMEGEPPLTIQNLVLFLINLIGVYRWLIRPTLGGEAPNG